MNKTANQRLIEAKSERDVEQALLQAISTILPTQEKFERVFGRGQWQGYLKKLIGGQDILKGFMRESNAGDYAWIKIALGKAKTAQDLKTLIQKLERQISK